MKNPLVAVILLAAVLALVACGGTPTPDIEATAQAALAATEAAQPTDTPVPPTDTPVPPTDTPTPTDTPVPPTDTPTSTNTPVPPTDTPTPTDTPEPPTDTPAPPTDTPTPVPPSPTPAPVASPAEEHLVQGLVYFEQKQWNQAIVEFQAAIRLDPEIGLAYLGLGYSYALSGQDLEAAIAALEKYLQLEPDADDRAEVEADIQQLREALAQAPPEFEVPPGKALFVFVNYTDVDWSIDVGSYHMDLPAWQGGEDYPTGTLVIEPGTYTWQAHSPGGGYYITDASGNQSFEFTVAADEVHAEAVGGPPPR